MSLPLIASSTSPSIPLIAPPVKPPEKNPVDAALSRAVYAKQREKLLQPSQSNRSDPKETRHISMEELSSLHRQCVILQIKNETHIDEQRSELELLSVELNESASFTERLSRRSRNLEYRQKALGACCAPLYLPLYNTIKKICLFLETIFLFLFPCLCQNNESANESLSLNPQIDAADPVLTIPLIDEPSEGSVNEDEMAHASQEAKKHEESKKQNELLRAKLGLLDPKFQEDKESNKLNAEELREKLISFFRELYFLEQQLLDVDQAILEAKSESPRIQMESHAIAAGLDRLEREIVFLEEMDFFTPYVMLFQAIWGCLQSIFDCSSSPENITSDR
jgi:hypothetical protein